MHMRRTRWTFVAIAALLPAAALAADKTMKPGMYDYTVKMEMPGMPFEMPPQNFQTCVKQDDVNKGKQYQSQRDQDCELKNMKQSAGKVSFDIACKDGTTGHAEYASTETSMSGKTVMNRQGQAMTMSMSAKRVGDCK
jgi:hypothetical protein